MLEWVAEWRGIGKLRMERFLKMRWLFLTIYVGAAMGM